MLTRLGLFLLFLIGISSTPETVKNEGFCTASDNSSCLQEPKAKINHDHALEMSEVEEGEKEQQHFDSLSLYTGAYLDRSIELLRTEDTFFAHLYEKISTKDSSLNANLSYRCPGLIFSFNTIYLPSCPQVELENQPSGRYFVKYRCHTRDPISSLPTPAYKITTAPVTSIAFEPYFGIPTPTSLAILVAHFEYDISLSCDQISPLGLTTSNPELDPEKEVAILVGNGLESRRVRLADMVADGERLQEKEKTVDEK